MLERDGLVRKLLAALLMAALLVLGGQALAEDDEQEAPQVALALGAVANGVIGAYEDVGTRYTYQLGGEGPWLVTVKVVSQSGSLRVEDDDVLGAGLGAGIYMGSQYPRSYEFRNVYPGGTFAFTVSRAAPYNYSVPLSYTASVTAERIPVDEVEDNGDFWLEVENEDGDPTPNPNVLALSTTPMRGEIGIRSDEDMYYMDMDCYKLALDEDATIQIRFKSMDHPLYFELFTLETDSDAETWEMGKPVFSTAPLITPVTNNREFGLKKGVYGIIVGSLTGMSGRYEISYADTGKKPVGSVTLKKTAKLTAGGLPLDGDVINCLPNFGFFEDFDCWSSNPKVVDCSSGWPVSVNPGTATVTFDFGSLGKKRCKVTVYKNEYARSKPLKLAGKGIYTSAKRMWYGANGTLWADIFVYNKTGKPISVISDMILELRTGGAFGDVVFEKNLGAWGFKGKIANNGYKVYRAKLTPEEFQALQDARFDLRNQEITATLDMNCSAKGLRVTKLVETGRGVIAGRERK